MAARQKKVAAPIPCATFEGSVAFSDGVIERYRLTNGLELLVMADKSAPTASYFTWYKVGSRHEKPGKTGLAHLFEHLMFNETESLKAGQLIFSGGVTAPVPVVAGAGVTFEFGGLGSIEVFGA